MPDDILAPVLAQHQNDKFILRLYVAGSTPQSSRAITNIKTICETYLKDRYVLTVVDLYEQKERAQEDQIEVAPTLIRQLPLPVRRLVGDLSQTKRVLAALDLPQGIELLINPLGPTPEQLMDTVADLRAHLAEASDTLSAIRNGEVDAVLVQGPQGNQLFTLKGVDDPYRVLIEEMNQGAVTLSADGSILYCNRRFADLLKTPLEEIVGLAFVGFVAPSERAGFAALMEAGRTGVSAGEITLSAGDASAVPLQLALGPLPIESAAAICLIATDISESRNKEVRLLQTMEETVKAEQALEESNKHLLRKNEEIQNFYHTVSHELKTPLTSAREFISIVLDGLAGPLTETQREYLSIARESCHRLRVCINDLMDATRLETGKLTLEMKRGSLATLVQKLVTLLGPVAARKQISLKHEVRADLPDFLFDQNRLMQVLVNLANNALKFTPENGQVTITAGEAPNDPGYFKVSVNDTGCGIAPAELERIFECLYQVPNKDGGSEQGVGLGLYICRELVQSHGGKIWVESELGRGSTFCFSIPQEQPSEAIHVLIADDDPRIIEIMTRGLEPEGFRVTTASDGAIALEKIRREVPDVVVMDLEMPNMDGAEMLKQIRQNWGLLPVILHTGFPHAEIMRRAMEFSPFTVLAKPCGINQLVETIRSLQPPRLTRTEAIGRPPSTPGRTNIQSPPEMPVEMHLTHH
jgi:signal transduction histidine kinase/CheY-like chemotaxis protein